MLHVEERILVNEVAKLKKEKEEKGRAPQQQADGQQTAPHSSVSADLQTAGYETEGHKSPVPEIADYISADSIPLPESIISSEAKNPVGGSGEDASTAIQGDSQNPTLSSAFTAFSPLYPKERLIVQQLMRHGEKVMYIDEESSKEITVAEYVATELALDEIKLSTPLFTEVLQELLQHISEPGFTAERHFIAHANPTLSRLAVDLIEEKYQLSKYHSKTQTVLSDADRLTDIIPHLMIDYKHALVEIELKETLNLMRQPDIMNDPHKCMETMERYKELTEIKKEIAKHLGDRVISN